MPRPKLIDTEQSELPRVVFQLLAKGEHVISHNGHTVVGAFQIRTPDYNTILDYVVVIPNSLNCHPVAEQAWSVFDSEGNEHFYDYSIRHKKDVDIFNKINNQENDTILRKPERKSFWKKIAGIFTEKNTM
jgi:hypothetical protein